MLVSKVIVLLGSFSGGGSERAMINFSNGLIARGIEVDVLVGRSEGPFRFLLSEEAKVVELGSGMLKSIPKIRAHIKGEKNVILFSSQLHVNIAAIIAAAFNSKSAKVVLREATTPSQQSLRAGSGTRKRLIKLSKVLFKKASHIIAVSDTSRDDSIEFYGLDQESITTIYAPFVTEDFLKQSTEEVSHPWFEKNEKVICSMGRVMPVKDFGTLIKAFALVRRDENCKLLILGDTQRAPEYYKELKTLAENLGVTKDIDFAGFKRKPFPYLAKSHVYVLSSLFEGLPGSLVQGLALGCHVVSTDCKSGPREILKDGSLGDLVAVGDEVAMSEAILKAIKKPRNKGRTLGKVSEFSEQKALDSLLSVFESLLRSK